MALIIENNAGRRMVKLSTDDVLTVVSMYQQKCNSKNYSYEEIREIIRKNCFYLPEDFM